MNKMFPVRRHTNKTQKRYRKRNSKAQKVSHYSGYLPFVVLPFKLRSRNIGFWQRWPLPQRWKDWPCLWSAILITDNHWARLHLPPPQTNSSVKKKMIFHHLYVWRKKNNERFKIRVLLSISNRFIILTNLVMCCSFVCFLVIFWKLIYVNSRTVAYDLLIPLYVRRNLYN